MSGIINILTYYNLKYVIPSSGQKSRSTQNLFLIVFILYLLLKANRIVNKKRIKKHIVFNSLIFRFQAEEKTLSRKDSKFSIRYAL